MIESIPQKFFCFLFVFKSPKSGKQAVKIIILCVFKQKASFYRTMKNTQESLIEIIESLLEVHWIFQFPIKNWLHACTLFWFFFACSADLVHKHQFAVLFNQSIRRINETQFKKVRYLCFLEEYFLASV